MCSLLTVTKYILYIVLLAKMMSMIVWNKLVEPITPTSLHLKFETSMVIELPLGAALAQW